MDVGSCASVEALVEWGTPAAVLRVLDAGVPAVARIGVVLMWGCTGGAGRVAPVEARVEETETVEVSNFPHPSAAASALLATVGAVLESADPIEGA